MRLRQSAGAKEGATMPTYIVLRKFNEQGIRNIKNLPEYSRQSAERAAKAGVVLKGAYLTQGEYDLVMVLTDHSSIDYPRLVEHARHVVDTRNACRQVRSRREKITKA